MNEIKSFNISAKNYKVGKNTKIGKNVNIKCDNFRLGDNCVIGDNVNIHCTSFIVGDNLFMWNGVEVGRGGSYGPNSEVIIGDNVGIFENTIINPSEKIIIGNNVGIGAEVMIWTHGAWLDVMQGFPADFGPVTIGDNVWLPARSIVLPNVEIGDNTVIGIGSTVNKNIPSGCLAAGSPCKVIKENYYPKKLSSNEKLEIIDNVVKDYRRLAQHKSLVVDLEFTKNVIILKHSDGDTVYDLKNRTMTGNINESSEDFRDYLRRRGIKIFTENPFKSI